MVSCKTCGTPIFFVRHERTGSKMCLNQAPSEIGNVVIVTSADEQRARVLKKADFRLFLTRYVPHFASCSRTKPLWSDK